MVGRSVPSTGVPRWLSVDIGIRGPQVVPSFSYKKGEGSGAVQMWRKSRSLSGA